MGSALLTRGEATPNQLRVLGRVSRAAERANRLITDLLDFTQARMGKGISIHRQPMDLVPHVVGLLAQTLGADRRQVVEDDRLVLVDQGTQQLRGALVHRALMVHQRGHAAKQLLVRELGRIDAGHAHRLQPAQHAEFGVGVTQPVEHHHAQRVLDRRGVAGPAEHTSQRIEAKFAPQLVQRPHVPQRQGRFESNLRRGDVGRATPGTQQG